MATMKKESVELDEKVYRALTRKTSSYQEDG